MAESRNTDKSEEEVENAMKVEENITNYVTKSSEVEVEKAIKVEENITYGVTDSSEVEVENAMKVENITNDATYSSEVPVKKAIKVEENTTNDVTDNQFSKRNTPFCAAHRRRTIGKAFHLLATTLWWFGFLFGIYGAIRVSMSTYRHYKESPTVISMERDYKEWNTSFPAVTICPDEKFDNDSLDELVEQLPYKSKFELRSFLVALAGATYNNFEDVPEFPEIHPSQYMDLLLKMKFKFIYSIISSRNNEDNGTRSLTPTITERGLCYAFNSDVAIYNSPDYWQSNSTSLIPRKWSFVGNPLDGDVFAQILDMNSGYLVYVHGPNETLDFSSQSMSSPSGYYKTLSITALTVYSSEKARSLSVKQRACRFLEESTSQISPVYSYSICRNQCRMNLAYSFCKCVPHFYKPMHERPICDVKGMHCLAKYKEVLSSLRYLNGKRVSCNCLPSCNDVNYVIENEHTTPWFLGTNLKWGISIYPKMRLKRDVLFSFDDVLLSIGSSIGVFLGCSLLSLVQITYFICACVCRCICKIFKACNSCVVTLMFGKKNRYLTSASSTDCKSTTTPYPVLDPYVANKLNGRLLNPIFLTQHI